MPPTESNLTDLFHVNASDKDYANSPIESLLSKNLWALLLLLLCTLVVFGNVLVILSVAKERALQNITNYLIVSLAVADLLVAGVVMPFYTYTLVNWGLWYLPARVCDFYIAMDVVCSTSSIFNLVAISLDRYCAVTSPISYSQHRKNTGRAYLVITICWMASLAIGSPILLGINDIDTTEQTMVNQTQVAGNSTDLNVDPNQPFVCAFYNPDFIIYSSLGSFYIPCIAMIVLYFRIFKTLNERSKIKHVKLPQTHKHCATNVPLQESTFIDANAVTTNSSSNNKPECNGDDSNVGDGCGESKKVCAKCAQVIQNGKPMGEKIDQSVSTRDDVEIRTLSKSNLVISKVKKTKKKKKGRRDKSNQKKEKKATKTLAIVLVCFLVCWTPFFSCNTLEALSMKFNLDTSPGEFAFLATTLLGYINSCVNPIIYTIFNPEFRKAFKRVLGLGH